MQQKEPITKDYQILLADDDSDDRNLFKEAVAEITSSVKVKTVEDGTQLMEVLSGNTNPPPDMIFLDINMPGKTGKACLTEIRSDNRYKDIPVIIFSTSSFRHDIEETYRNGASMYIPKSVFFEDEVSVLKRLLAMDWKHHLTNASRKNFVLSL